MRDDVGPQYAHGERFRQMLREVDHANAESETRSFLPARKMTRDEAAALYGQRVVDSLPPETVYEASDVSLHVETQAERQAFEHELMMAMRRRYRSARVAAPRTLQMAGRDARERRA